MAICEICYDSGRVDGVGYCGCLKGKNLKDAVELHKKVAKRSEVKVTAKKQPPSVKMDISSNYENAVTVNNNPIYQEGDWVELDPKYTHKNVEGIKAYVLDANSHSVRVQTVGAERYGVKNYHGWMENRRVFPSWEENVKVDPCIIDLALQTKDKEWFKQLTRGMK